MDTEKTLQVCIKEKRIKDLAQIMPSDLGNVKGALKKRINKKLFKYSDLYKGVLLSFRKLRISNELADIHDEDPNLIVDIKYTAKVFQPEAGSILVGSVTQIYSTHITLLVFGLLNTVISSENISPKIMSQKGEDWIFARSGNVCDIGSKIQFEVLRVEHEYDGYFSIEGEMKNKAFSGEADSLKGENSLREEFEEVERELLEQMKINQESDKIEGKF